MAENTVEIIRARADQRGAIAAMMQLYIHDFSEFFRPGMEAYLGDDGRFAEYPHLDEYWSAPDREAYLIRANGVLAGFALINKHSHSGRPLDYNVGEFFVARPNRKNGVGAKALREFVKGRPGIWEAAISIRNIPAQRFWPRAIAQAGAVDIETLEGDGEEWTGPIMRFRAP